MPIFLYFLNGIVPAAQPGGPVMQQMPEKGVILFAHFGESLPVFGSWHERLIVIMAEYLPVSTRKSASEFWARLDDRFQAPVVGISFLLEHETNGLVREVGKNYPDIPISILRAADQPSLEAAREELRGITVTTHL